MLLSMINFLLLSWLVIPMAEVWILIIPASNELL